MPFFLGVTLVLSTTVSAQQKFVSSRFAGNESVQALAYGSNIARIVNGLTVGDCGAFCLAGESPKANNHHSTQYCPIRILEDIRRPISCSMSFSCKQTIAFSLQT
jgi:hypothetical protein